MNFTFRRDRTIASVLGRTIEFKKDTPTHVPPMMYDEVLAAGGEPEDELEQTVEMTDAERAEKLKEACKAIALRGNREDFTGAGVPHRSVLSAAVGFYVGAKERDIAWNAINSDKED